MSTARPRCACTKLAKMQSRCWIFALSARPLLSPEATTTLLSVILDIVVKVVAEFVGKLRSACGIALAAAAALLVAAFAPRPRGAWIPLAFIVVLFGLARWFGTAAGVLGSTIAAAIFALWLYAPLGSFNVASDEARPASPDGAWWRLHFLSACRAQRTAQPAGPVAVRYSVG